MKNELINDIDNYISYLLSKGLYVSVHGKMISGLIKYNLHKNPYCSFIKTTSADACMKCIGYQKKVLSACNNDCLFGMCWAGVEEYVFYVDSNTFISIGGYGVEKEKAAERINKLSRSFRFDKSELWTIYEHSLKHEKENEDELKTLIKPLCHMLSLLQITISKITTEESKNKTFDSVLAFIQSHITQNITLSSIADACACSESTVSHLFKEYTNKSVKKYVNELRIKQAEEFLLTSDMPIGKIALLCGFDNTNYFTTAFKKQSGMSPSEYRLKNCR